MERRDALPHRHAGLWGIVAVLVGCAANPTIIDAGPGRDAGVNDSGEPPLLDAAAANDSGLTDATVPDAEILDSGSTDSGAVDAGAVDAGPISDTSAQIQAARDAFDGAVSLPIDGAIVTYLKPALGLDAAGFFVQADPTGPALFVAVDPSSLSPVPDVGATVAFQIDRMDTLNGLRVASELSGFVRRATGADVEGLRQELSGTPDLLTALPDYESELIRITGRVAGPFRTAGIDHLAANFDTSSVSDDTRLRVRFPATLVEAEGIGEGCVLTVDGPLWRFLNLAQPSAYEAADLAVGPCPAPTVVGAVAQSPTEVRITFDRPIDPTTLVASATQFGFDAGLTASAAELIAPTQVRVVTSMQTPEQAYTVTVGASLADVRGTPLASPRTARFGGYAGARLLINEVTAQGSESPEDYIELVTLAGGTVGGWTIEEWASGSLPAVRYTFDLSFNVAADEIVVLHFDADGAGSTGYAQEDDPGSTLDESSIPDSVPTAWDVYTTRVSLTSTDNFIVLRDSEGFVVDALAFSNRDGGISSTMERIFNQARADAAYAWDGFTEDADGTNDAAIQAMCAATGNALGRSANRDLDRTTVGGGIVDTDTADEWCVAESTMGLPNADCAE